MRRADRLFQIIQILRRGARPVTAGALAEELEVSTRTVYRDIADLMGQRAPIQGEAGVGYVLGRDFDMPPLMLTPDEIEAAVLGAQWVAERGDRRWPGGARPDRQNRHCRARHLRPFIVDRPLASRRATCSAMTLDLAKTRLDPQRAQGRIRYRSRKPRTASGSSGR